MTIELTVEQERLIELALYSGHYAEAVDLIGDALARPAEDLLGERP